MTPTCLVRLERPISSSLFTLEIPYDVYQSGYMAVDEYCQSLMPGWVVIGMVTET